MGKAMKKMKTKVATVADLHRVSRKKIESDKGTAKKGRKMTIEEVAALKRVGWVEVVAAIMRGTILLDGEHHCIWESDARDWEGRRDYVSDSERAAFGTYGFLSLILGPTPSAIPVGIHVRYRFRREVKNIAAKMSALARMVDSQK